MRRPSSGLHEFSMRCAQLFATHNEEVLVLLGDKGDPRFLVKVKRTMMPFFLQVTGVSEDEPNVEYLAAFMFHTMFGLVSQWHENGRDLPPEEFLDDADPRGERRVGLRREAAVLLTAPRCGPALSSVLCVKCRKTRASRARSFSFSGKMNG